MYRGVHEGKRGSPEGDGGAGRASRERGRRSRKVRASQWVRGEARVVNGLYNIMFIYFTSQPIGMPAGPAPPTTRFMGA